MCELNCHSACLNVFGLTALTGRGLVVLKSKTGTRTKQLSKQATKDNVIVVEEYDEEEEGEEGELPALTGQRGSNKKRGDAQV